jgi:hypothetical protein
VQRMWKRNDAGNQYEMKRLRGPSALEHSPVRKGPRRRAGPSSLGRKARQRARQNINDLSFAKVVIVPQSGQFFDRFTGRLAPRKRRLYVAWVEEHPRNL